LQRRR